MSTATTTSGTTIGGLLVFATLFFLSHFMGEFCFESCPLQPPSIFPISSIGEESAIYFLSSSDFVSQSIINNIFSVSSFLMATLTYGDFSSRDKKLATAIASIISINKVSILAPSECLWIFGRML